MFISETKPSKEKPKTILDDDLFGEDTDTKTKPVKQENVSKIDDDLFGDIEPVKVVKKEKPVKSVQNNDLFGELDKPVSKEEKPVKQDIVKPIKKDKPVKPEDDLFGEVVKPVSLAKDLFTGGETSTKPVKQVSEEDDLFASLGPIPKPKKPVKQVEDDLFAETDKKPIEILPSTESQVKSIFSDAPTIEKEIKTSDNVEVDLFASSPPGMKVPDTTVCNTCIITWYHIFTNILRA